MKYTVYYKKSNKNVDDKQEQEVLNAGYSIKIWTPLIFKALPKGLCFKDAFLWSLLYLPEFYRKLKFAILLVYFNGEIAQRTFVLSKCLKFPFMSNNDLQIGPCDTEADHRRKGLARYVIDKILKTYSEEGRIFWWVARTENEASRSLIEKAGFKLYGEAEKRQLLFINQYVIVSKK